MNEAEPSILPTESKRLPTRLLIFAKLPQAGKAKTRMIPRLGAEGAANLHRELASWTFARASRLLPTVDIELQFTGGTAAQMQSCFDVPFRMEPQVEGDLGERMRSAFERAFAEGHTSVVAIGTDCPAWSDSHCRSAVRALARDDVVLGPAGDGGYYLLAMRKPIPELFSDMPWSQAELLEATRARLKSLGLTWTELETLDDIDRPEDLEIWQRLKFCEEVRLPSQQKLSVIVACWNDDDQLRQSLQSALKYADGDTELIVVEGGTRSASREICAEMRQADLGPHWYAGPEGRGKQFNFGTSKGSGELLLFLHCDTQLPANYPQTVREGLTDARTSLGAYRLRFRDSSRTLSLIERGINFRSQTFKTPYGDQAFFLRRETFDSLRGFRELPIMEDYDLVRRAKKIGRVKMVESSVTTSPRRWREVGMLKTSLINQCMILGFHLGVAPERLRRWYRGQEDRYRLDDGRDD